jgi:hypothetical protein
MHTPSSNGNGAPSGAPASLAERIDHEALAFHSEGTAEGEFLARQMERLAQLIRWSGATSPEDHEQRMEVWDEEVRRQHYDRGFAEGRIRGIDEAASVIRASCYARSW